MKKLTSLLLTIMLLSMSLPALARASDQIDSYSITIVPRDSGKIEVTVNIAGTHPRMTKIGFPTIILYERAGTTGTWSPVSVHSGKYNPNATAGSHTYTFTYQGVAGRNYYTYASFFAQDSLGSDSRTANSPIAVAT